MKNRFASLVFVALIVITFVTLVSLFRGMIWERAITPNNQESAIAADSLLGQRADLVFILGEDEVAGNPYYAQATNYFRFREMIRLENLVVHCRSLSEVYDYLLWNKSEEMEAWGNVHLVVHGNQWNGLGLPVVPDGPRVTASSIRQAQARGYFDGNDSIQQVLDFESELIFHACGTGRDRGLINQIAEAFGGKVKVRSSNYFVTYESVPGVPQSTQQYLSEYWFTTYPTGFRPADAILANQLEETNLEAGLEWIGALSRTSPRWVGDTYHYRFSVPVTWTVTFGSEADIPVLKTKTQQKAWLATQQELLKNLAVVGIPSSRFTWTFEQTIFTDEQGKVLPAIQIFGKSSVLCVLRAITEGESQVPMMVDVEDVEFYSST